MTGAVAAVAGVLLVVVLDSAVPLEDDTSATSRYLIAGGIGFGVGTGYAFLRCRINRPSSRSHYAAVTGLTHEGQ